MSIPSVSPDLLPAPQPLIDVFDLGARVYDLSYSSGLQCVLHVINGEHFSGAERVQQLLGKQLPVCGFAPLFACVKPGKFSQICGLPERTVIDAPMRGRFDFSVVNQLKRYVLERSVVLLHAHTPRTAMITSLVALRTGLPWIYHVHSPTSRDSTRGFVNRLNTIIERYSIRNCNCLITVSESLAKEMQRQGVPPARLVTVPNGVPAIDSIDAEARRSQTSWRLGMVALMRPRKGVEVALQAMHLLKKEGLRIQLDLIGGFETREYEQQISSMISQLQLGDCVSLRGFTKDVPAAIRELDALLLPSLFGEGMPMVVLESLAAGVPVIATRVEGTPEVIRDGIEGYLAEPRNPESLVEKIRQLIGDRAEWIAMSGRALARHRSSFSDRRMAEGVAAAYNKVLGHVSSC
jgi:glycosyltransferase involved in cell wall biosynthesis